MNHPALALSAALLGLAPAVGAAQTCEAIQARIDAKIRASGVKAFTLRTVDAAAKVDGKVVGSCDLGSRDASGAAASSMRRSMSPMAWRCFPEWVVGDVQYLA